MKPGGDRVRCRGGTGQVVSCTGLRDSQQAGEQLRTRNDLHGAPLLGRGRRLIQSFAGFFEQDGKTVRIDAWQPLEFSKEGLVDAGFGHAHLESGQGGIIQAGDRFGEQAHRVRADQRIDSCGRKPRVVVWSANGLDTKIGHDPRVVRWPEPD